MNKKISWNQAPQQESHQRDKHLACPSCMILRAILKIDKERTSTNRPKDKKASDYAQVFTPERDNIDRLYVSRKEWGRGLTNIEDSVDASI